jgi:membrane dipeptidase
MLTPIFDGHNDFLLRLIKDGATRDQVWAKGDGTGHMDLPRMRAGGFAGGFFAIYIPSPADQFPPDIDTLMGTPPYDIPLPAPVPLSAAQPVALAMAGQLLALTREYPNDIALCLTVADIRAAMAAGRIAAVMHFEGAEAIDEGLDALHLFYAMGLRSVGPVWSRPTIFGHGVPFRFPGSPDTGPGLTDAGRRLVRACNTLKIMVDLSHMNEAGFMDVAGITDAPLVATHSNAHAVSASTRNLTDRQLAMIRDSGGLVGLNYAVSFLRPDGLRGGDCGWDPMLRHLDQLMSLLGEDQVGLGSDFDGAAIPDVMGDVAGQPRFIDAMRAHGYDDALLAKLAHGNWLAVLERTWGA